MRRLPSVGVHTFKSKVQLVRLTNDSTTFRVTVPMPIVTVLDLGQGAELVWSYDPSTRKVTVGKGQPAKG
jgi:hypothetical protein